MPRTPSRADTAGPSRRDALKALAGLTGGLLWPRDLLAAADNSDALGPRLPLRRLGRTGEHVTHMGLGGWHVGDMSETEAQAVIEAALEGGVRFFDTAESYQDGESETRYGRWLTPKYREHVFLMTKSTAPDAATARSHLEGSLQRLQTDVIDLWQVHAVRHPGDVDARLEQGVLEEMLRQQAAGRVRHIGFTGHRSPQAHARMLARTDVPVACQMPINLLDPSYQSFILQVLPTLVERDLGVLAMKTLSNGRFFRGDGDASVVPGRVTLRQALSFVWSLPVSVLIHGPDDRQQLRQALEIARDADALDEAARQALVARAADLAGTGVEYYKA